MSKVWESQLNHCIPPEKVVATDLVVGSLLKQLQDTGIAGREIADIVDLNDIDGPAKQIADTMLTAIYETKKARFVLSDAFRGLGAGKKAKCRTILIDRNYNEHMKFKPNFRVKNLKKIYNIIK